MEKTLVALSLLLALTGCGDAPVVYDHSGSVSNLPYPAGTCFTFNVPIKSQSFAYRPDSFERGDNSADRPPRGSYVFIVPVDIKDLTPVPCK